MSVRILLIDKFCVVIVERKYVEKKKETLYLRVIFKHL